MTVTHHINDHHFTIVPSGQIDSATSSLLQECIEKQFVPGITRLALDFADVDFISSKGLRILVATYKGLNGRAMEVVNANTAVTEVFRLSGILSLFCK